MPGESASELIQLGCVYGKEIEKNIFQLSAAVSCCQLLRLLSALASAAVSSPKKLMEMVPGAVVEFA